MKCTLTICRIQAYRSDLPAGLLSYARQKGLVPCVWMKIASLQCTPSDLLGKALDYAYKLWPWLRRYALDGNYQIDNNAVERCQRPSVLGRKNYLFSKSDRGRQKTTPSSTHFLRVARLWESAPWNG